MPLNELKILETKGNNAVKELRRAKFKKRLPFMINSIDLPRNQCYLEYADGRMVLVSLQSINSREFTFIRELTDDEKEAIRIKYHLA